MADHRDPRPAPEDDQHTSVAQLLDERSRLLAIGYRMLGSRAEAEDAVQEAYVRWYRLTPQQHSQVVSVPAWLVRTMSRICLDMLRSARRRREQYVGEWLPEPAPADGRWHGRDDAGPAGDPADRITLPTRSVSMALLVVLDAMTPAERVAFVLHDVFRHSFGEIADDGRRASPALSASSPPLPASMSTTSAARDSTPVQQREVVESFVDACLTGDVTALIERLDPAVTAISDGGGRVRAALRPVVGADRVARFLTRSVPQGHRPRREPGGRRHRDADGAAQGRHGRRRRRPSVSATGSSATSG